MKKLCLFVALFATAGLAQANSACDKPRESRLEAQRVLPVKSGQIKKRNLHAYRACVSRRKSA